MNPAIAPAVCVAREFPSPAPRAVQLRRQRGAKLPPDTIIVSRRPGEAGVWGNPYQGGQDGTGDRAYLVRLFRELMERPEREELRARARVELWGANLACWCSLCEAHRDGRPFNVRCQACADLGGCHRDVWGEVLYGPPRFPVETILYYRHGPQPGTSGASMVRVEGDGQVFSVHDDSPLSVVGIGHDAQGAAYQRVRNGRRVLRVATQEWERVRKTPEVKGSPV